MPFFDYLMHDSTAQLSGVSSSIVTP